MRLLASLLFVSATASADPLGVTAQADAPTNASSALPGQAAPRNRGAESNASSALPGEAAPRNRGAESIDIGFRIGGYGFRRQTDPQFTGKWDECRMNGVGIFGQRGLRGPLFLEVGIDAYFSSNDQPQPMDLPVDRASALVSTAIGARTEINRWMVGYIQLGVGAELTRVSVPYADGTLAANKVMPEGFIGVGGDIKIGEATRFGASIRTLVMGNFNYDAQRLNPGSEQWSATPTADQVFSAEPTLAAQAQFYVRRDL